MIRTRRCLLKALMTGTIILATEGRMPAPNCPGGCATVRVPPIYTWGESPAQPTLWERLKDLFHSLAA
jgi:hypothetical protein